jgi:hypothetical protein
MRSRSASSAATRDAALPAIELSVEQSSSIRPSLDLVAAVHHEAATASRRGAGPIP